MLIIVILINALLSWFLYIMHPNLLIMVVESVHIYMLNMKFLKINIVYNIALAIKCKYEDLNRFLIKGCCKRNPEMLKSIGMVSFLYGLLGQTVNIFNRLFGWDILLFIFHSTMSEMACFNFIKMYFSEAIVRPQNTPIHQILNFFVLSTTSMVSGKFNTTLNAT